MASLVKLSHRPSGCQDKLQLGFSWSLLFNMRPQTFLDQLFMTEFALPIAQYWRTSLNQRTSSVTFFSPMAAKVVEEHRSALLDRLTWRSLCAYNSLITGSVILSSLGHPSHQFFCRTSKRYRLSRSFNVLYTE